MPQPNILFLISDQHAPQVMGCMGADFVRTPNMDRLADDGVLFENAYCVYPHCVPSRASLMTGLECHRIPCYDNGAPYSSALPTWAHMLRSSGYQTIMDGKMHFVGPDQHHGFHEHWHEPACAVAGFRWGEENPDASAYRYWSELHFEGDPKFENRMAIERARVDSAVEFLEGADPEQPFCLTVGFYGPHYPMICTQEMFESYDDVDIPEPLPDEHLHPRNRNWRDDVWGLHNFTEEQTRNSRQAYLAMVTTIDDWMGEVLQALERSGLADDTIIIYAADHGEMWGEHGLWGKQTFYEESARVPLIISAPERGIGAGKRIETPVSLLDIYPTLREMCDVRDWDVALDGRSLWRTLANGGELEQEPVFSEYYGPDTLGPERMVRCGDLKLNYYHNQPLEMFDLAEDPRETRSVAQDPDYAEDRERLLDLVTANWDPEELDRLARIDQNRRTLVGSCYPDAPKAL
mgnify:CR=1 FL=1